MGRNGIDKLFWWERREEMRPLRKLTRSWEDNIKIYLS
jgi:hypothetical protein